jgi:phosphatidylethanolamine-binding protein (PEBP) family uncharacterized protein
MIRSRTMLAISVALGTLTLLGCAAFAPADPHVDPSPAQDSAFSLTSEAGMDGGLLPQEYTCDGAGASPALSWSGAPAGTEEFALMMTTLPGDGTTKWSWIVYGIPSTSTGLVKNSSDVDALGARSYGAALAYEPPCAQGPGPKWYTFTIYALSASPSLPADSREVTGEVLGSASLSLSYARP